MKTTENFLYCVDDGRSLQTVSILQRWIQLNTSPDDFRPQMSCDSEHCILIAETSKFMEQKNFYLAG